MDLSLGETTSLTVRDSVINPADWKAQGSLDKPIARGFTDRPYTRQPPVGQLTAGRSFDRQPTAGRSFDGQSTTGRPFDRQPTIGRPFDRQPIAGQSFDRQTTTGQSFNRQATAGQSFDRQPISGRPFDRQATAGQSFDRPPIASRPFDRQPTTGRSFDIQHTADFPMTSWSNSDQPMIGQSTERQTTGDQHRARHSQVVQPRDIEYKWGNDTAGELKQSPTRTPATALQGVSNRAYIHDDVSPTLVQTSRLQENNDDFRLTNTASLSSYDPSLNAMLRRKQIIPEPTSSASSNSHGTHDARSFPSAANQHKHTHPTTSTYSLHTNNHMNSTTNVPKYPHQPNDSEGIKQHSGLITHRSTPDDPANTNIRNVCTRLYNRIGHTSQMAGLANSSSQVPPTTQFTTPSCHSTVTTCHSTVTTCHSTVTTCHSTVTTCHSTVMAAHSTAIRSTPPSPAAATRASNIISGNAAVGIGQHVTQRSLPGNIPAPQSPRSPSRRPAPHPDRPSSVNQIRSNYNSLNRPATSRQMLGLSSSAENSNAGPNYAEPAQQSSTHPSTSRPPSRFQELSAVENSTMSESRDNNSVGAHKHDQVVMKPHAYGITITDRSSESRTNNTKAQQIKSFKSIEDIEESSKPLDRSIASQSAPTINLLADQWPRKNAAPLEFNKELDSKQNYTTHSPRGEPTSLRVTPPLPPLSPSNTPPITPPESPDAIHRSLQKQQQLRGQQQLTRKQHKHLVKPHHAVHSHKNTAFLNQTTTENGAWGVTNGSPLGEEKKSYGKTWARRTPQIRSVPRSTNLPNGNHTAYGIKQDVGGKQDDDESDKTYTEDYADHTYVSDAASYRELVTIKQQMKDLESMYSEVLWMMGVDSVGRSGSQRSISSSSSISRSRQPGRLRHHNSHKRRFKEFRQIHKRFQRLESHVVTLARSVAHLSSEMRSQNALFQEVEQLKQEVAQLRESHRGNDKRFGDGMEGGAGDPPLTPGLGQEFDRFRCWVPALTNSKRVKKLTKFFGQEPPWLHIFLQKLGYDKYIDNFERENIGMLELPYLNDERLQKIGIPMGPRTRILQEAQLCFRQQNFDIYIV